MYNSKDPQRNFLTRPKASENKPSNTFFPKDYEDEKGAIISKPSDSGEINELRNKLKLVMTKLSTVKKEKQTLQKQNKSLQGEVINLQSNLRQMVAGFSNTSSNFPIHNQLGSKFAEFYKYECLDMFFDILYPELSMKGIIVFYFQTFNRIDKLVQKYFDPSFESIKKTGCFETIQGPILNVMRKAFQTNHSQILKKIQNNTQIDKIVQYIQAELNICEKSEEANAQITKFLLRLAQLRLYCFISDPPFDLHLQEIGQKVCFNPLIHDPLDGFIKPKEQCWIVLPCVKKSTEQNEVVTKSLVLQVDYDLIN